MSPSSKKSLTVAAISSAVLAVTVLGLPSHAATSGAAGSASPTMRAAGDPGDRSPGSYDARTLTGTSLVKADRRELSTRTNAEHAYYRSLGPLAVVDIDPLTHTPRDLGRLDGFLTGSSTAPARAVALGYVRQHLGALGLTRGDLRTFRFRQDYVDTIGVHHLSWTQAVRGATVFGNGLRVQVTADGRVLSVQGSPVAGLAGLAADATGIARISAPEARSAAADDVGATPSRSVVTSSRRGTSAETVWSNDDYAQRVWFLTPGGLRAGWSTYVQSSAGAYQHVIDALTGRVLYRHANTAQDNGDAQVYDNYPGAARGGTAKVVNFFTRGWLRKSARFLKGSSVTAFADINDDNRIQARERTPVPGSRHGAQFTLRKFGARASGFCATWVCTWNPKVIRSWKANRRADATNAFYLASNFHDYLAKSPIGFTPGAGNFSAAGHDPLRLNTLDGASIDHGMPDFDHTDNANMSTPPNGISPTMQMYLWHLPGASDSPAKGDPFVPTSGAFDASILYHEYAHGLSNRLVVDADGNSTLNDIQAGSMGEAWSDYYALDYLVTKGFLKDTKRPGQLLEGRYVSAGRHLIRTMPIDCPVGARTKRCTSGFDRHVTGGYTYGDFPTIVGQPEVHGSGEIWGQTLWDLRTRLGHRVADTLITRAMSLSANDPDFLDMRNAILRADLVAYDARHQKTIWRVFAHRGMGYYAGSLDSADQAPAQDFHVFRAHAPRDGTMAGVVTDPTSGDPVQGALVQVAGQSASTTTGPDGFYEIDGLVTGKYKKLEVTAPGYLGTAHAGRAVSIGDFTAGDLTNFKISRDWAAVSGRAEVVAFDGPDTSGFGCGPLQAFDMSLATGWGSLTGHLDSHGNPVPTNVFEPKSITVKLPTSVDIDSFQIDPDATCGDAGSSSTGHFTIETSTNGSSFDLAVEDTFGATNRGHLNREVPAAGTGDNVQFVRFTILGNQVPNFATTCPNGTFDGCTFTDLTELAVLGTAH